MGDRELVQLWVTEEQRLLIEAMWMHNGWDLEFDNDDNDDNNDNIIDEHPVIVQPVNGLMECQFCFSRPCVTDDRFTQLWWDQAHAPHRDNSKKRKSLYKRFWVMLANRGAWNDPRYLERKELSLEGQLENPVWVGPGARARDIMPQCVLDLVRHWWPNPQNQPYMGHRWQ